MDSQSLKVLGIIGARSGSKGVPDKNILPLAGKPLMAWIIEAALQSKHTSRVIVSTDSESYAEIARKYGAEVPHLRPKELALDESLDIEYIKYVLDWLKREEDYLPDIVLRLLPTTPLQMPGDIDLCVEQLIKDPEAHSAVVVAEARQHPQKSLVMVDDGKGDYYLVSRETKTGRDITPIGRQKYEKAYFRANVIASRIETIDKMQSLTGDKVRYHIIPQERALDIDSLIDFYLAEQLIKKFK